MTLNLNYGIIFFLKFFLICICVKVLFNTYIFNFYILNILKKVRKIKITLHLTNPTKLSYKINNFEIRNIKVKLGR